MREVKTDQGVFKVWEGIKELPQLRYVDLQKYAMQEAGLGSTMADVDRHFHQLDLFLKAGDIGKARQERNNLHYNIYLAINKIQIGSATMASIVHSINGERIDDYSESNLFKIAERLDKVGLNRGILEDILADVKKKLIHN